MCKKIICLVSFVLVLVLAGNASAELVAQWKLDDGGATAMDATDNGNDGTLEDDPTVVEGQFGYALAFDGSRVAIGASDTLTADLFQGSFTMSAWINPTRTGNTWQQIFRARKADGNANDTLFINNDGRLSWRGRVGGGWAGGMCETAADVVPADQWTHVAVTGDETNFRVYVNGVLSQESAFQTTDGTNETYYIGGDYNAGESYSGMVDDLRVYNHVLSENDIRASMENQGSAIVKAYGPDPKNGTMLEATWVSMSWRAGDLSVSHDVYMGDNFDDVNNGAADTFRGNLAATMLIVGFPGYPFPDGLVPGTTYYWRVDGVNPDDPNSPWKGDVWSFWIPPRIAWQPAPADEAQFVPADVTLEWTAGFNAKLHTVYFGDDFDTVDNAAGGVAQTDTTFTPGTLELDKTYYWRVDEFDPPATHTGDTWSFTTMPAIPLHSDPDLVAWWTFDEGEGATALDWSGHGNHITLVGSEWVAPSVLGDTGLKIGSYGAIQNLSYAATDLTEVSVAAWVRTSLAGGQYIVSFDRNEYYRLEIAGSGGGPGQVGWDVMTSSGQVDYGSVTRVDDGAWHHITGVYDKGQMTIYIDGLAEPSVTGGSTFGTGNTRFGFIGANSEAVDFDGSRGGGSPVAGEVDDIRIYHRALTAEDIVLVMRGDPLLAWAPSPATGSTPDIDNASPLSWSAGDTAASHDVYFGTDLRAVADAGKDSPEFQGNQTGTSLSLASLIEFGGGDYYWRIDEVEAGGTVHTGTIWKFTVPDYLTVDDIESYNDLAEDNPASNRIYLAWIDGFGTTTNGAVVGNMDVPLTEHDNVHGGGQAMPYSYDNNLKTSEATLTLARRDWTGHGVTKLSLWFYGDAANAAERMFVALNGSAVVYHDDPAATQTTRWTEWVIDLTRFADQGVNLANVNTITIGFGTKNSPAAGGAGTMYFDDIRLYR